MTTSNIVAIEIPKDWEVVKLPNGQYIVILPDSVTWDESFSISQAIERASKK